MSDMYLSTSREKDRPLIAREREWQRQKIVTQIKSQVKENTSGGCDRYYVSLIHMYYVLVVSK